MAPHPLDRWRQPQRLVAALALAEGQRVAEVGAGGGYLTPWLAAAVGPAGTLVATDVDEGSLQALAQRTAGLAQVERRLVTADDPGLEPRRYDRVVLVQVDHLLAPGVLARCWRAVRPGGQLLVSNAERYRAAAEAALATLAAVVSEVPCELPGQFLLRATASS